MQSLCPQAAVISHVNYDKNNTANMRSVATIVNGDTLTFSEPCEAPPWALFHYEGLQQPLEQEKKKRKTHKTMRRIGT